MATVPAVLTSRAIPSSLVAGASLLIGFLVAQATGVRALGGVVLLVAVVWCFLLWRARAGVQLAVGLTVAYAAAFVLSHAIARVIGAIPSVLLVSIAVAALAFVLADRR